MPPEVEQIKQDNLNRYLEKESSMSNPSPIRQAYLEVKDRTFVADCLTHLSKDQLEWYLIS